VFGGGKVIRDGMGQDGTQLRDDDVADLVITNVVVIDYTGIYKADVLYATRTSTALAKRAILKPWMG
jgi:hypothetical protein